ncbi:MAG: hypothetical protein ACHQQQ_13790 [Bacteroidota bacterium]
MRLYLKKILNSVLTFIGVFSKFIELTNPRNRLQKLHSLFNMTIRSPIEQSVHDLVIQTAFTNLDKVKYDVYINRGNERNTSVSGEYPDIIVTGKNEKTVKWIIEVETSSLLNQSEIIVQWTTYSNLGGIFYILVPKEVRNIAEQICVQNNIKARFGTYVVNQSNVLITYE